MIFRHFQIFSNQAFKAFAKSKLELPHINQLIVMRILWHSAGQNRGNSE